MVENSSSLLFIFLRILQIGKAPAKVPQIRRKGLLKENFFRGLEEKFKKIGIAKTRKLKFDPEKVPIGGHEDIANKWQAICKISFIELAL